MFIQTSILGLGPDALFPHSSSARPLAHSPCPVWGFLGHSTVDSGDMIRYLSPM